MSNKREGFRRISILISWLLTIPIPVMAVGILIAKFVQKDYDKITQFNIALGVGWTVLGCLVTFFMPRLIYKAGCYIADGFKEKAPD